MAEQATLAASAPAGTRVGAPQSGATPPPVDWQSGFAHCLAELSALGIGDAGECARLRKKLDAGVFTLVVVGQFKRGKSSLINALLGQNVLPVGVVPLTSSVTVLRYGSAPMARVEFQSGELCDIGMHAIADYATEKANPNNIKSVRQVIIDYPSTWLRGGIQIVDTPGIDSVYQHNTDSTYAFLSQADAMLFVTSADQPLSRRELEFLAEIRHHADKFFCLLNKSDYLTAEELQESLEFSGRVLLQAVGKPVPVYPVSARLALTGKLSADAQTLERSGFQALEKLLHRFISNEKSEVWRHALTRSLLRLLSDARLKLQMERQSLSLPRERSQSALEYLAKKHPEMLGQCAEYEVLLAHEVERLYLEKIEPGLKQFKEDLKRRLPAEVNQWYTSLHRQHVKTLEPELDKRVIAWIRDAYDSWRASRDREWNLHFETICLKYWSRIQVTVDELLQHASELLSVPYQAVNAELLWQAESGFYYKFWDTPPSLLLLRSLLLRLLPGFVRDPLILRQCRQRAVELVETQAGRVRYDFDARLRKNLDNIKALIRARVEATLGEIQTAIRKGAEANRASRPAMDARRTALDELDKRLTGLRARLETTGATPPVELSLAGTP